MRISRLFISAELHLGQCIDLPDEAAHYVRTVLRLKKNQNITLFNGAGGEFECRLTLVSKKQVSVEILEFNNRNVESSLDVNLGLGISRGDRMDWAIQKAVELGVNQITPLMTERCVIKFTAEKKEQRLRHWRSIAQHAAEQCGRNILTSIADCQNMSCWVEQQRDLCLFLDPLSEQSMHQLSPENRNVTLLTGPEGGFSDNEREIARANGFIPVKMGPRILRTETAAMAALAAVQTLWGDFG